MSNPSPLIARFEKKRNKSPSHHYSSHLPFFPPFPIYLFPRSRPLLFLFSPTPHTRKVSVLPPNSFFFFLEKKIIYFQTFHLLLPPHHPPTSLINNPSPKRKPGGAPNPRSTRPPPKKRRFIHMTSEYKKRVELKNKNSKPYLSQGNFN